MTDLQMSDLLHERLWLNKHLALCPTSILLYGWPHASAPLATFAHKHLAHTDHPQLLIQIIQSWELKSYGPAAATCKHYRDLLVPIIQTSCSTSTSAPLPSPSN